ncbi:MAG: hypothetical protein ACYS9X_10010 [Planctomycetota bacterium]|jgi:hypothetical protein
MKRCAVVIAALGLAAPLAGCGGVAAREASSLKLSTGTGRIRGIDVWNNVERIFPRHRVVYQENKAVNPIRKNLAITLQDTRAPYRVGEPGPDETSPLTFENAARELVTALDDSRVLLESDLTYDAVEDLAKKSAEVVLHAREAVKALELKDRELKLAAKDGGDDDVAGVWQGANVASEEDEARALVEHWMPRAKLIEHNATNLWTFAATHRKPGIVDWSAALMKSCKELEDTYPAVRRRRRRPRPRTETETKEDGTGKPGEVQEEKPEGGSEEGPAKAATPGTEEHPETGSGSPPVGEDGDPKPDAGPPQVGAFLLGVAGRRRSSRSRSRSRSRRRAG